MNVGELAVSGAYTYLGNLGATAFAWEFLRRNFDYKADFKSIKNEDDAALVHDRWDCAADPALRASQLSAGFDASAPSPVVGEDAGA